METRIIKPNWFEKLFDMYQEGKQQHGKFLVFPWMYWQYLKTINLETIATWFQINIVVLTFFMSFFTIWFTVGTTLISPFVSSTQAYIHKPISSQLGYSTIRGIKQPLQNLTDTVIMTNFVGVRFWADNRNYQQIGELRMYRRGIIGFEEHLARNRASGGANSNIGNARAAINTDYEGVWPLYYDTQVKKTINYLDTYEEILAADSDKKMMNRRAVFIANSDNFARFVELLRSEILTSTAINPDELGMTETDDAYYRIRGNLIALYNTMLGAKNDFKDKMLEKGLYEENFEPMMEYLEAEIAKEPPMFVFETGLNHVSGIIGVAEKVSTKLGEIRDKLNNG